MRYLLAGTLLILMMPFAHAQNIDKEYLEELEIGCAFGLTEDCEELVALEEEGKFVAFTICNRTAEVVRVAIADEVGEIKERRYRARGWWSLDPEACHNFWEWPVKDAPLHVSILHLIYAESESGAVWQGEDAMLCTPDGKFDIAGDHKNDCRKRGYTEIDIFKDRRYKTGHLIELTP